MDARMGKVLLWYQIAINMLSMVLTTTPKYPPSTTLTNGSSYELIIVGGGTAGGVIATRLAEAKKFKVLLIEAGGDPPCETRIPSLVPVLRNSSVDWKYSAENDGYTEQCNINSVLELGIGKMLGGTSELNYMIYSRGNVLNYDRWYRLTNDTTWKWPNVLPYYIKSENVTDEEILNTPHKIYHGTKGPIKVSRDRHAVTKEYLQAFKQAGNEITIVGDGSQLGYSQGLITVYKGRREATASSYLTRVRNNRYLTIAKKSLATKIIFDDQKNAVAVEVINDKKQTVTVKASKEIIVTAGAVKSPQLLMLIGIGPKAHLDKMKIKVIVDSPEVGKNFQDHFAVILFHRTNRPSQPNKCGPNDYISPLFIGFVALNKSSGGYPDYHAMDFIVRNSKLLSQLCSSLLTFNAQICQRLLNQTINREVLVSLCISNVDTKSRGQVMLRRVDPEVQPRIRSGVFSNDKDLEAMIDYLIDYVKVEDTDYFRKNDATFIDPTLKCNKFKKRSREHCRCYSLCIMGSMGHFSGTCAMGTVVDSRLRVRGVQRLRVADASMMPSLVSGNSQQPIIAVAEKVSDWLIKGH